MKKEMWLIWKQPKTRRRYKIGILTYMDNKYSFKYVNPEINEAIDAGFTYFPGFNNLSEIYTSDAMFVNIETRLPNPNRDDYLEILNMYNLERDCTKLDILSATRGRLITDNYEFIPAFNTNKLEFDVAGTRHSSDIEKCADLISVNDKLYLELEPDNKYDKDAIKVILKKNNMNYHIGYVPRYYSKELKDLLINNVEYSALIQSLNFESVFTDEYVTAYVKLIINK